MSARLNCPHSSSQNLVVLCSIRPCMNSPVTVGAKGGYVPWIIWATVAQASDMMWLKIRQPIAAQERGWQAATLAVTPRAGNNISCDISASLYDSARRALTATGLGVDCLKRQRPEPVKIHFSAWIFVENIALDVFQVSQLEDESTPNITVMIWYLLEVVALVNHLAKKPEQSTLGPKKQKSIAVSRVMQDPPISAIEAHVATLTFTKIFEHPVWAIPVVIPVSLSRFSGDYRHDAGVWGDDTTLPLPAKPCMYVIATAIKSVALEPQCHSPVLPQGKQSASSLDWQGRAT
jgi:hypothetical protein